MRGRVALAVAALSLALGSHGGAALVVRANGNDVTNRLRGDGLSRTPLLAGVPGHDNMLRLGRNTLTIVAPAGGQSTFSWRPRLERVHLVVVGNRIDFAAYSSMATLRAEVDRISPWAFPDPARLHSRAELDTLRARCGSVAGAGETPQTLSLATPRGLLYDCATTLLPGGANADGYRESVVTADVTMPVTP